MSRHNPRAKAKSRWYDQAPTLAEALNRWQDLYLKEQMLVADHLSGALKTHTIWKQDAAMGIQQIGPDKLAGLYKSKRRQRWYDQYLPTHHAVNMLYLSPNMLQAEMGVRLLLAIRFLEAAFQDPLSSAAQDKTAWLDRIFKAPVPQLITDLSALRFNDALDRHHQASNSFKAQAAVASPPLYPLPSRRRIIL